MVEGDCGILDAMPFMLRGSFLERNQCVFQPQLPTTSDLVLIKLHPAFWYFPLVKPSFHAPPKLYHTSGYNSFGTEKMLEMKIPFNSPIDIPTEIHVHHGDKFEETSEIITIPACNQYTIQGDEFSKAIIDQTDIPSTLDNAYLNTKTIEALFRSAESGQWEGV